MKRITLFLLLSFVVRLGVWAWTGYSTLVVEARSGDMFEISLRDKPQIKLGDKEVFFVCGEEISGYIYDEVSKIYFKSCDPADIVVQKDERIIRVVYVNQTEMVVAGVESADMVALYALDGSRIAVDPIVNDGALTLPLGHLVSGTYVLNIGNKQSIKFLKR